MSKVRKPTPRYALANKLGGLLFFIGIAVGFLFFVPLWWIRCKVMDRQIDFAKSGAWFFGWFFPLLGVSAKVEGKENIPSGSFVVLSNHQSFMDIGTIMVNVKIVCFLAKKELFQVFAFGPALAYMGSIPVDRENPRANVGIPDLIKERLAQGFNYCVFPEGTRSEDGSLLQFKNGIFRMLHQAPVHVLPVTLDGTGKALPKRGIALFRHRPRVVVHPVITPEEIAGMTVEQFRDRVRSAIESGLPKECPNL